MYTWKEKVKIVESFKESGVLAKDFAPTWNVSVVSLRKWVKIYNTEGPEALKTKFEK